MAGTSLAHTDPEDWAKVRAGDRVARGRVIEDNYGLVRHQSIKMHRRLPPSVNLEDVVSYGALGLIRAVDNYRPNPVPFAVYATASIRSAILDELRSQDWAPRSLRRRQRLLDDAVHGLTGELGREPTDVEVEAKLGVLPGEAATVRRAVTSSHHRSLDEVTAEREWLPASTSADEPSSLDSVAARFVEAFSALSLQEQVVLVLKYFPQEASTDKMTLSDVGASLGLTERRVRQLHTRAVTQVKDVLRTTFMEQEVS